MLYKQSLTIERRLHELLHLIRRPHSPRHWRVNWACLSRLSGGASRLSSNAVIPSVPSSNQSIGLTSCPRNLERLRPCKGPVDAHNPIYRLAKEFGIERREPPAFFSSPQEIDEAGSAAPLPHALRRAFKELQLDGILCLEKTPIIYFRQVQQIEPEEVVRLHRLFWNQGVAPILVLIAPHQVHVYSGLTRPAEAEAPKLSIMVLSKSWTVSAINFKPSFCLSNLASISIFIAKRSIPSNGWIETCSATPGDAERTGQSACGTPVSSQPRCSPVSARVHLLSV